MFPNIPSWIVYTVGFTAQFFFTARTLLQWLQSERKKSVQSPTAYWFFSVLGAYTMFVYGVMRDDFSIILGQLISYFVYLWNLDAKGIWRRLGRVVQVLLIATPAVAVALMLKNAQEFAQNLFHNDSVPLWLLVFGSAGQVIFTLRFIYQWLYSSRRHESTLPRGFWIISLVGSSVIIAYGIFRKDPVLILGQAFGFVAYVRNLIIGFREQKNETEQLPE